MDDSTSTGSRLERPASRLQQVTARHEDRDRDSGLGLPGDMVSPP